MGVDNGLKSIAFPCISTGVFGYPNDAACCVALRTVRSFLETNHKNVDRVVFCLFLPVDIKIYNQRMPIIFPSKPEGEVLAENQDEDVSIEKQDEKVPTDEQDEKGPTTEKQNQDQEMRGCIKDEKKEGTTVVEEREDKEEGMDQETGDQMETKVVSPKL